MRWKTLAKFTLFLFFGVLILRLLLFVTEPYLFGNNIWVKDRVHRSIAGLRAAPKGRMLLVFVGASEMETGFDPVYFDELNEAAGIPTWSLNLGIRNNGTFLPLYFGRIEAELVAKGLRPSAIIVQIPISRLTQKALAHFGETRKTHDLVATVFDHRAFMANYLDTETKLTLAVNKYFLGERSLMQLPLLVDGWMPSLTNNKPRDEFLAARGTFTEAGILDLPGWRVEDRGSFYRTGGDYRSVMMAARRFITNPENFRFLVRAEIHCCDFRNLNLSKPYVLKVQQALVRLAQHTDRLIIVTMPENPVYSRAESNAKIRQTTFDEMAAASGGVHLDLSGTVQAPMFVDLQHLTLGGVRTFAEQLATRMRPLLN
jgi:hypothetical protein